MHNILYLYLDTLILSNKSLFYELQLEKKGKKTFSAKILENFAKIVLKLRLSTKNFVIEIK